MPKLSIYVPNELAERMEAVTVNWSAVAQRAFQRELLRIEAMKDAEDNIVARLRASRVECRAEDEEAGKKEGADWARQRASWRQLERAGRFYELTCRERIDVDFYSFAKSVLNTAESAEMRDFCETWVGEDCDEPSSDFMEGFLEGAVEVWNEVAHKV